jgi:hypothetical protein
MRNRAATSAHRGKSSRAVVDKSAKASQASASTRSIGCEASMTRTRSGSARSDRGVGLGYDHEELLVLALETIEVSRATRDPPTPVSGSTRSRSVRSGVKAPPSRTR